MNRGVIFDVDGVLIDSYAAHLQSWRDVAARRGLSMTDEQFASTFGRTSREIIGTLWGDLVPDVAAFDRDKETRFREIISTAFPAMDGAAELVDALAAAGFRLAVGSSGPPPNVELTLDRIGKRSRFRAVITGHDVERGKPDPQVFQLACERLALEPAHCVVIEDAPAGIEAARAAGTASVALASTGRREGDFDDLGADLIVRSLRELTPEVVVALIEGPSRPLPSA